MSLSILVADDSATIQKVIKIAFSKYPVEIMDAASYHDAIRSVKLKKPNLLIVDANLPGVRSPGDFLEIQTFCDGAPILMLAGSYEYVDEEKLRQVGLKNILKKPFDTSELVSYVTQTLGIDLRKQQSRTEHRDAFAKTLEIPQLQINEEEKTESPDIEDFSGILPPFKERHTPQPIIDTEARGKKAFDLMEETTELNQSALNSMNIERTASSRLDNSVMFDRDEMIEMAKSVIKNELKGLIQNSVTTYCKENFAEIAREVILHEIRRLADEKSQFLIDS